MIVYSAGFGNFDGFPPRNGSDGTCQNDERVTWHSKDAVGDEDENDIKPATTAASRYAGSEKTPCFVSMETCHGPRGLPLFPGIRAGDGAGSWKYQFSVFQSWESDSNTVEWD